MDKIFKIVSIGPALVDITITLNETEFDDILDFLNTRPGSWISFNDFSKLKIVFERVTGYNFPSTTSELVRMAIDGKIKISAGSTNLGVFSAFPKELRKNSAIITAIAKNDQNEIDPISQIYTKYLRNLSIDHITETFTGKNPLGIVLTSIENPDRVLLNYLGVAYELTSNKNINSEYLYLDSYELQNGAIAAFADKLIKSNQYKVALGLSNHAILNFDLKEKISNYISNGNIYFLTGNQKEFEEFTGIKSIDNMFLSPKISSVPYILITNGEKGLYGKFQDEIFFQKGIISKNVISTSGAGDIAAGTFISGIAIGHQPQEILLNAASLASKILSYQENIFPEGR
jgi:sugar/nucleoside kinase (ribokinase family)